MLGYDETESWSPDGVGGARTRSLAEGFVLAEYSGTDMGNNLDGVFDDGVADLHERIVEVHRGPRLVKDRHGVTLTKLEDIVAVNKRRDVHSMDPDTLVLAS